MTSPSKYLVAKVTLDEDPQAWVSLKTYYKQGDNVNVYLLRNEFLTLYTREELQVGKQILLNGSALGPCYTDYCSVTIVTINLD